MIYRFNFQDSTFQLNVTGNGNDISKHVATVYIKGNWFVIPLAVYVLGTEFPKYLSLVQESASTQNTRKVDT